MRSLRGFLVAVACVAASTAVASRAIAQAPGTGTVLHLSPYAGYMMFGNYLSGPLGTSLSNAPAPLFGAQVGLSLSPELSLVGNIAHASSDMKVGIPFLGGISVGRSSMLIYDASLEYNLGSLTGGAMPFTPFIQAGAGAIKYDITAASVLNTNATNFAANVGIGADLTVGKGMAVRLLAKDYIGKFDFKGATGLGISGNTAHNWALSAGLRLDF